METRRVSEESAKVTLCGWTLWIRIAKNILSVAAFDTHLQMVPGLDGHSAMEEIGEQINLECPI